MVYRYFEEEAPGRIVALMECTQMASDDLQLYNAVFDSDPFFLCAKHWSPVTRPRLWWANVQPEFGSEVTCTPCHDNITIANPGVVRDRLSDVLELGFSFLCHTRHVPKARPEHDPRGLHEVSRRGLQEWAED
eukprot:290775-Karenia_brevis.AAC.1